jgi:hypothetical protein
MFERVVRRLTWSNALMVDSQQGYLFRKTLKIGNAALHVLTIKLLRTHLKKKFKSRITIFKVLITLT